MILKRLAINRLPGIDEPFEIEATGPGIHIIFGPNGIGKSSICRALERLFWKERGSPRRTWVSGEFEWESDTWQGERDGSIVRWNNSEGEVVSPDLPPSHNYRNFFLNLRDLIDASTESTADIAVEIRRQMSGGFNLEELATDLFTPATHRVKRRRRKRFNEASTEVQRAEGTQSGLQGRVDRLEELESQLERAKIAASRLPLVKRAIGLADRRLKLARIVEQLNALPESLPNLTGKEQEIVEEYRKRWSELEKDALALERDLRDARKKQKDAALAAPLAQADLAAWRKHADELERIELALDMSKTEQQAALGKLDSALQAVGGNDIETEALSLPQHGELFAFLRDSQSYRTQVDSIRERIRLLEAIDPPACDEQDLETFRSAAETLRTWLRLPEPQSPTARIRSRLPWLLSAIAALAIGTALAFIVNPLLASIAAMGAGIGLAALFAGKEPVSSHRRQAAQAAYEDLGIAEPPRWNVASVASALRSLESRTTELEATLKLASEREIERKRLESKRRGLAENRSVLEARRGELQSALRLPSLPADAELVDFARALDQLRLARGEYKDKTGKVQRHERSHTERLAEMANFLEQCGEPKPDRAAFAKAHINDLAERNTQLTKALEDERKSETLLERNADDRKSALAAISGVYAEAGLDDGDSPGLASLLDSLPQYRELSKKRVGLESQIELDETELKKTGECGLLEMDGKSLEKLEAELDGAASEEERLRSEIAGVTAEKQQARRRTDVQNLIAAREEARATLRELRDKALFSTAGSFLIDDVEREYEQTRMPRVFERARDHFSNFTFHNYELRLEKGNGTPRLSAIDLRGRKRRELHELSDGTRVQLLLAARIAFAEEVEQGRVLPLFLDEALDQSDPQRFDAIVQSLGCVAKDQQRQIFYLTSDPLDVDRIRNALDKVDCTIASSIDLGLNRIGASSVSSPDALRIAPPSTPPQPENLSPEEYGAALAVPAFRPYLGFSEQHMLYVLWDDLTLLHDFLTSGIERAGQWKTVSDSPLAERLGRRSMDASEIGLRLNLLEVFCELWCQGRGRRVDRDALAASNALTTRFLDDVVAIAMELDGDPEHLLAVLSSRQDNRLRGFQRRSYERLLSFLVENEYLDDRPVLTEAELRLLAMATPAANALSDGIAIGCIHQWWGWADKSSVAEATQQAK